MGGIISYDNRIKRDLLGVRPKRWNGIGAVSEACALEMAAGAPGARGRCGRQRDRHRRPRGGTETSRSAWSTSASARRTARPWSGTCGRMTAVGNKRATADAALKLILRHLMEEEVTFVKRNS